MYDKKRKMHIIRCLLITSILCCFFYSSHVTRTSVEMVDNFEKELIKAGLSENGQMGFNHAANAATETTHNFHDDLSIIVALIFTSTFYLSMEALINFHCTKTLASKKEYDAQIVELLGTLIPIFIIGLVLIPSLSISYILDTPPDAQELPEMTLEVTGHQGFGSYRYQLENLSEFAGTDVPDYIFEQIELFKEPIEIESYALPELDLLEGSPRMLKTDHSVVVPEGVSIRILANSEDVAHSGAMPDLGVKVDSYPGRVNQAVIETDTPGTYYGQCSEVCGAGHSQMPIQLDVVPMEKFIEWIREISAARSQLEGWQGLKQYLKGSHGHVKTTFDDPDATFAEISRSQMSRQQAKLLHKRKLINGFFEWLGIGEIQDKNFAILENDHLIGEEGKLAGVDKNTYAQGSNNKYYEGCEKRFPGNTLFQETTRGHYRPGGFNNVYTANPNPFQIATYQNLEPDYLKHEYTAKIPNTMMYETTRRMMFSNFPPRSHNLCYFRWRVNRLWIGDDEFRVLDCFPKPDGPCGEQIAPLIKEHYFINSQYRAVPRVCGRFLTMMTPSERLGKCRGEPANMTIYMQAFDGSLVDSGIPIGNGGFTTFKGVTMPPDKVLVHRMTPPFSITNLD